MEFHEILQQLRKQKNLTQEELAAELFVSRTAVSKWESGRGYPGIESLKAISKYFSIPVDNLISGGEIIRYAQTGQTELKQRTLSLMFGVLDSLTAILLFLPVFGQPDGAVVRMVALSSLTGAPALVRALNFMPIVLSLIYGIIQLVLQNMDSPLRIQTRTNLSLGLTVFGLMVFISSRHPYAGLFFLSLLLTKGFLLLRNR